MSRVDTALAEKGPALLHWQFGEVLRVVRIGDWKALPELEVTPSRRAVAVMPLMSVNV